MSPEPEPTRDRLHALRTLGGLAWPIVVSRSTQVTIGLSDALMVASLGQAALAATTTGALNFFALLILPMGLVFIVSSFSSQLFGAGDLEGARRYGVYGLVVAAATQLLSIGAIFATGPVLAHLSYAPDVQRLMDGYLTARLLSAGPAIGLEALANYYGGLGDTRSPMRASVGAMALTVLGNWMLIGGHLGAPAMGVTGAGIANAISTWLAFLWLLRRFLRDGRRSGAGRLPRGLNGAELRRMIRFGLPSGLNWFFEFFAFNFFVNVIVAGLGTTALAAFMTVLQINNAAFMPAFGLASAGAILVGQAIGRGAPDEVPAVVRLTAFATGTWQGLIGLVYLIAPGALFGLFAERTQEAAALTPLGVRLLMLSAGWQLFDSTATALAEALRAAGDTAFTLWARLIAAWLVFVPGAYVSVRYYRWGDAGAVLWIVLYLALLAAALLVRFQSGAWRRIRLTELQPEA